MIWSFGLNVPHLKLILSLHFHPIFLLSLCIQNQDWPFFSYFIISVKTIKWNYEVLFYQFCICQIIRCGREGCNNTSLDGPGGRVRCQKTARWWGPPPPPPLPLRCFAPLQTVQKTPYATEPSLPIPTSSINPSFNASNAASTRGAYPCNAHINQYQLLLSSL